MKKKYIYIMVFVVVLMVILSGCGKKGADSDVLSATEEIVEEKDYLSVDTSIYYSAGNDGNWSYVNQRKEFPNNEACYVRIGSTAIADGGWFSKGVGDEITVTYRFTGVENCEIEVAEGRMATTDTGDSNVVEFTRVINAAKEKEVTESVVIFRYLPDGAEKVTLEVIYDDQIAEKYDALNNVYFEVTNSAEK